MHGRKLLAAAFIAVAFAGAGCGGGEEDVNAWYDEDELAACVARNGNSGDPEDWCLTTKSITGEWP